MIRLPTVQQLRRISSEFGFEQADDELAQIRVSFAGTIESYERLGELEEPPMPVRYPRFEVHRPSRAENPLNAWYWKCSIPGAASGCLVGKTVAVKDNICVAGVPMTNGSSVLEGYVPEFDATVVTRVLDAGGEIIGKAVCESLCFAGNSFTASTGPVLGPIDPAYSAGGSASGCGAVVASGECDLALGCDQGGSIRVPASMCGIVGLKPTYGLVPYTGIIAVDMSLDHVGPMGRTVEDVALLLTAIAGDDELDPRQKQVHVADYLATLEDGVPGLRVGFLEEGFGWPGMSEADVDEVVRSAAPVFTSVGAEVHRISIPMHRAGGDIWPAIVIEGSTALMYGGDGVGTGWRGHYPTSLLGFWASSRRARANDIPDHVKRHVLWAQYMREYYHGRYYARAQNVARSLAIAYERALAEVDVIAMPTIPMKPPRLPERPLGLLDTLELAGNMSNNTTPLDLTGHPAISVPCGISEGLPIGLQLVARRWDEATLLRAARAFERARGAGAQDS